MNLRLSEVCAWLFYFIENVTWSIFICHSMAVHHQVLKTSLDFFFHSSYSHTEPNGGWTRIQVVTFYVNLP